MHTLPKSLFALENQGLDERKNHRFVFKHGVKDKNFIEMQRQIAEEYKNLQEVLLEMDEAEAAYYLMKQMRRKILHTYKKLANRHN